MKDGVYYAERKDRTVKRGKLFLIIGFIFLIAGCANPVISTIPVVQPVEKMEIERPVPIEVGLLITEESKNQTFRSPAYADFHGTAATYQIEPFRLATGEVFEKAAVHVFSQIFQKVHLVHTVGAAGNYPVVLEPKLESFHLHLFYKVLGLHMNDEVVDMECTVGVSAALLRQGKPVWQKTIQTARQTKTRVFTFWLKDEVGSLAADTMGLALKDLAGRLLEENRNHSGFVGSRMEKGDQSGPKN